MSSDALRRAQEAMATMDAVADQSVYTPPKRERKVKKAPESSVAGAKSTEKVPPPTGENVEKLTTKTGGQLVVGTKRSAGEVSSKGEEGEETGKKLKSVLSGTQPSAPADIITEPADIIMEVSSFSEGQNSGGGQVAGGKRGAEGKEVPGVLPGHISLDRVLQFSKTDHPMITPKGELHIDISPGTTVPYAMIVQSVEIIMAWLIGVRESAVLGSRLEARKDRQLSDLEEKVRKLFEDDAKKEEEIAEMKVQLKKAGEEKVAVGEKYRNLKKANDRSEKRVGDLQKKVEGLEKKQAGDASELASFAAQVKEANDALKKAKEAKEEVDKILVTAAFASFDNALNKVQYCNPDVELKLENVNPRFIVEDDKLIEKMADGSVRVVLDTEIVEDSGPKGAASDAGNAAV